MKDKYYKFHCRNGKTYGVKEGVCFACKKCSDIFFDWNGPYGYSCEGHITNGQPYIDKIFDKDGKEMEYIGPTDDEKGWYQRWETMKI